MQVRRTVIVVIMSLALLCPLMSYAQDKSTDNMQLFIEKLRADKKLLVAQLMKLSTSEAKEFWPVYAQYQDELFLLRSRTLTLIRDFAKAYEMMTEVTAQKQLDELMTIDGLGLKLRQSYLPKFRGVLPDIKVLRYYQLENKIRAGLMYGVATEIPFIMDQ